MTVKNSHNLIIENYPDDYTGFPFITLIQYRKDLLLVVVDNVTTNTVQGYVLDLCKPEGVDENIILPIIQFWYENNRYKYPLSIEFSRAGVTHLSSKLYRTLNHEYITRYIGPIFQFPMNHIIHTKKRKKRNLPSTIEIVEH